MGKKLYKDGDRELYKLCAEVSNLEEDLYEILLDKGYFPFGIGLAMNYEFLNTKWAESKNHFGDGYCSWFDYNAFLLNIFLKGTENVSKEIYINVLIFLMEIADSHDSLVIRKYKAYELREKITLLRYDLEQGEYSDTFFDIVNKRYLEYQNGNGLKEMLVNYKRPAKDPFFS